LEVDFGIALVLPQGIHVGRVPNVTFKQITCRTTYIIAGVQKLANG
jgi:hypothetical protein